MRRLHVDPSQPDADAIAEAADVIRRGGLVAFPTETVYGLGAHALDEDAVRRIYVAKGRPDFNPLIVHVPDASHARALTLRWPATAEALASTFWPGPLTLVLPKVASVPAIVTAGLSAVGLRVPAHPVALALLRATQLPIAAPSANRFTQLSPTTGDHVAKAFEHGVDLLLDGGATNVGIESTVLDLSGSTPQLLRPGMVTQAEIEAVVGPVRRAPTVVGDAPRLAPGMVERHYAPRARLILTAPGEIPDHVHGMTGLAGALVVSDAAWPVQHAMRMPVDPVAFASRLYAALHALDDLGCTVIFAELPPDEPGWAGARDRLLRAAEPGPEWVDDDRRRASD